MRSLLSLLVFGATYLQAAPADLSVVQSDISVPVSVKACLGTIALADLEQRVHQYGPVSPAVHFLYSHGFADHRRGNHGLYETLAEQAFARISAPELPFHGDSRGTWAQRLAPFKTLDHFSHLARQTETVLNVLGEEDPVLGSVKVIRAGWSTGALLGIYELVSENHRRLASRYAAAVFYAPGVAVKPVLWVRADTLLDDPSQQAYPFVPPSPLVRPYFAAHLMATSFYVQRRQYPLGIPTLVVLGDDEKDTYVNNARTREWFKKQIDNGAQVWVVNTPYKHGVAFNKDVQLITARFVNGQVGGDISGSLGNRGPGVYDVRQFDQLP